MKRPPLLPVVSPAPRATLLATLMATLLLGSGCKKDKAQAQLDVATASGSSATPPDLLTARLQDADELTRYRAASEAARSIPPAEIGKAARETLFELLANPKEPNGVRLFAARALARLEPARALETFVALESKSMPVDGDAWVMLGPTALPHFLEKCQSADCPTDTVIILSHIISDNPADPATHRAIPLLLRIASRSELAKAIVYKALGALGATLRPLLESLQAGTDEDVKKAASEALLAIKPPQPSSSAAPSP